MAVRLLPPLKQKIMKNSIFIAAILLFTAFVFTACSGNDGKFKTEQLDNDEMYTCIMHNEVMSDHTGECPKCNMRLEKQKMTDAQMKMMKEGTFTKPNN